MATANSNSNSNSKPVNSKPTADAPNVGQEIAAAMLQAFRELAKASAPVRAAAPDRDPWEGVQTGAWSDRERDALTRLGWLQQGWDATRERSNAPIHPEHLRRTGPQAPDPKKVATGQFSPDGFIVYQVLAMICAKLEQYGKISVGHVALIVHAMGAGDKHNCFVSTRQLATKLQQVLKSRVIRTEDGYFQGQPLGPQPMHDLLIQCADRIIKG